MAYRFATDRVDNRDLASGLVLRSALGFPGFPVRLASEIFQRARAWQRDSTPSVLWDAMCGSGYLVTVLGLLHRRELAYVHATDISADAVGLAARNLTLLGSDGLSRRRAELTDLAQRYGKAAHWQAVEATDRLIQRHVDDLPHSASVADVFRARRNSPSPDLVISDVPYGDQTDWHGVPEDGEPVTAALRGIAAAVQPHAVIALSARARKIDVGGIALLERFRVGLRAVVLVRAAEAAPRR